MTRSDSQILTVQTFQMITKLVAHDRQHSGDGFKASIAAKAEQLFATAVNESWTLAIGIDHLQEFMVLVNEHKNHFPGLPGHLNALLAFMALAEHETHISAPKLEDDFVDKLAK